MFNTLHSTYSMFQFFYLVNLNINKTFIIILILNSASFSLKPFNTFKINLYFSWLQLFKTKMLQSVTLNKSVFLKLKKSKKTKIKKLCHLNKIVYKNKF